MHRILPLLCLPTLVLFAGACAGPDAGPDPGHSSARVDIATEEVSYTVGDSTFTGYFAYDRSRKGVRPGVIVVHEWWGHNDYARSRAEELARMGYTAFALDMYGSGILAEHPDDAMKFMQASIRDLGEAELRFMAALELLKQHETVDPGKLAAIGYCFGGGVVLHMARIGTELDVVASFHGSLAPMKEAEPDVFEGKVLVFTGEADPMVPAEVVAAFEKEMTAAGIDYELRSYPDTVHSFTNPDATEYGARFEMPLAYSETADRDSWARMGTVFAEEFGS